MEQFRQGVGDDASTGIPIMSRRKKQPAWWPGIYEGRTAEDVARAVGTAIPDSQQMSSNVRTPRSMSTFSKLQTTALRKDGKPCRPLNGGDKL